MSEDLIETLFTEKERNHLIIAVREAEIANHRLQAAQINLQQAHQNLEKSKEELAARSRIAQSTYKTILVLKDINPDAFEISWEGPIEDIKLHARMIEQEKKEPELPTEKEVVVE
jgi:hypothetical protein